MDEEYLLELLEEKKSLKGVLIRGLSPLMYACTIYDDELCIQLLQQGVELELEQRCMDNCYTALL